MGRRLKSGFIVYPGDKLLDGLYELFAWFWEPLEKLAIKNYFTNKGHGLSSLVIFANSHLILVALDRQNLNDFSVPTLSLKVLLENFMYKDPDFG